MSTVKSSSENLTLNADGVGSDVVIQNNGTETVRVNDTGVVSVTGTIDVTNSAAGNADAIELSNYSGDSSVIKSKRGLVLSADYDNNSGVSQSNISFETDGSEQANITNAGLFQFNSGYGSVTTVYGCRAWINFNGTGAVAIRGSGGVSSLTDGGTGTHYVNFSNTMPDTNYCITSTSVKESGVTNPTEAVIVANTKTTTTATVVMEIYSGANRDNSDVHFAFFR